MTESLSPHSSPLPRVRWRGSKIAIRVAKFAIAFIVFACLYFAIRNDLRKADPGLWSRTQVNWLLVAGAGLCLAGMNTVQMIRYRSLLRAYGAHPTWRQMAAIAWIPPLGKYVPGSVWALMGAIAMLRRFGINAAIAVSVVIMVDAFSEVVGLIFSVPLLMRPPIVNEFPWARWLAPPLLLAGIAAIAPPVFNRLLAYALRKLKRPPLQRMPTWGEYVVPVMSAVAQWLFAGGALWLMTRAVTPLDFARYPHFVMITSCAMAIGYLVFVSPGGIGPREWIFVTLLPPMLADAPGGTVTIVTVGMRLMQIVVEVALAGLGWVALRGEPRAQGDLPVSEAARPS
jgi:glycosyltransferase 2 family protein